MVLFSKKILYLSFFIFFFSYLYFSIRVPKNISLEDIQLTKLLNVDNECSNIDSFIKEIKCIKSIQRAQLDLIKGIKCRDQFNFFLNLGSLNVIKENTACCFDRSRITEQSLKYYGFKTRHIFLLHNLTNFRYPLNASHATTEVLTTKGWLGVDSNEPFILLSKNAKPITYEKAISSGLIENFTDNNFYKDSMFQFVGLYSRKGNFFSPYFLFLPELNYNDFFSNIHKIKFIKYKQINY